jgi:hypothetical protein
MTPHDVVGAPGYSLGSRGSPMLVMSPGLSEWGRVKVDIVLTLGPHHGTNLLDPLRTAGLPAGTPYSPSP